MNAAIHGGVLAVLLLAAAPAAGQPAAGQPAAGERFPVTVRVDAGAARGELVRIWRFFGADEPNYATMKDGQKLLRQLGELAPGEVRFRAHNLLTSGDGTPALKWGSTDAFTLDAQGRPVYDWKILDRIFDSYLERGVRPYAEVGFMPQALSRQPEPYRHEWRPGLPYDEVYTGWAHPPADYDAWEELVFQWARHCVERWGADEVAQWYWETWNEANIGYWQGTREEFLELHDRTVAAIRRALPTARVGGPDMAGSDPAFLKAFLDHGLERGTPLDFVAFHAKGRPRYVDAPEGGYVQMGIAAQLATIDQGFATIAAYPQVKGIPIVIGESDPEGCAACQGPQLAYRNGTMYSSYTAASFAREHDLAARHGINLQGALTWAFEFENQPYFAGFRTLASNGIPKPVLNVFRMFSKMGAERVAAESTGQVALDAIVKDGVRGAPDVGVLASRDPGHLAVLVWHYHDDDLPGPTADVELDLAGLPAGVREARVDHYRIDETHSNAYAEWRRMGSPIAPDRPQYEALLAASELTRLEAPRSEPVANGGLTLRFALPRQAVSLLTLDWR